MILDPESLRAGQRDRRPARGLRRDGEIKPELMESVLEISTTPCADMREAGDAAARSCDVRFATPPTSKGLLIGSAGTHPFALWEDQRDHARRRATATWSTSCASSRARRSSSGCTSTSARRPGQGDPRRQRDARARADPARAGAPTRRSGAATTPASPPRGCRSSARSRASASRRTTRTGTTTSSRIGFMVEAGVMEDYTWLWYDVRPHPNFGTVEIRAMDAQTHVEHTLGAGGADPGDGQGARRALRRRQAARATTRTRCSTRTSGSPPGTGWRASSSTCPSARPVPAKELAQRLVRPAARARAGPRRGR